MTTLPPTLRLTLVDTEDRLRIEMSGDLDYDHAELLLGEVTDQLAARPHLTDLHLHCAGVGAVDSMGLSVLLMIARRAGEAGVRLHLEDRSARLDRLLTTTGTLDYLTATAPTTTAANPHHTTPPPAASSKASAARPTRPDGTT
ncbi:STAS domain-containing protein [Streptomyces sp. SID14478]|uniref:STAS domain-containing protein n=1 Tax=Streptomyces sp. SID14478 TaxID=2706073 RepID=UPI0013DBC2D7|nr:STAS domain-containing protein [Streptomyces sp. SID14478]NEB77596.1 STAS domain-containing protein [Streptomyces sp. SID14478]